jgi:sulfofructosephosphate aldolase
VSNSGRDVAPTVLSGLQRPGGKYAMLALDQRESMRGMFPRNANGSFVDDAKLKSFKQVAIDALTPYASAVLLDRPFGLGDHKPAHIAKNCGLIVAVDVLHQRPGHEITSVSLDESVTPDYLKHVEADAIKLLVLWRRHSGKSERAQLVSRAIEIARTAGVVSLIEGIVRPDTDKHWSSKAERHDAILACGSELSALGPDIYKAEVPGYVPGDIAQVRAQSAEMTRIVGRDWVVLSNGVEAKDFAPAVAEALAGGASGFLAGRAIWADTVATADPGAAMRERSIDRLKALGALVDQASR